MPSSESDPADHPDLPAPRWPHVTLASFRTSSVVGEGFLWNVSKTGLFVKTEVLPAIGERIRIDFERTQPPFHLEGEVRWTTAGRNGDTTGFGVRLDDPPAAYAVLVGLLAEEARRQA